MATESVQHSGPRPNAWLTESLLFFVIGISGWWSLNAIQWAESPIFVAKSPEGVKIANLLSVACQMGNIAPFIYKAALSKDMQATVLAPGVILSQVVAIAAAFVCAFFWRDTTHILGERRSVVLLGCTVVAGSVGTLSNVMYWALAVRYDGTHCTKAMSVGTTVGGLVVSAAATLIQAAGENPRFSVEWFMIGVGAVQVLFLFCFCCVLGKQGLQMQAGEGESSGTGTESPPSTPTGILRSRTPSRVALGGSTGTLNKLSRPQTKSGNEGSIPLLPVPSVSELPTVSASARRVVLFTMFLVYALTYSLPSLGAVMVQAYSKQQSGHILTYMNTCQQIGDVAGRVATSVPWLPGRGAIIQMILTLLLLSGSFIVAATFSSQVPSVLTGTLWILIPALFFVYFFLRGYIVTVLYVRIKMWMPRGDAEHFTSSMGASGQAGAVFANVVLFVLIQLTGWGAIEPDAGGSQHNDLDIVDAIPHSNSTGAMQHVPPFWHSLDGAF